MAKIWACAQCEKPYKETKTLYRHFRGKHPDLTGGRSSDASWAILVDSDESSACPALHASQEEDLGVVASAGAAVAVAVASPSLSPTPSPHPPLLPSLPPSSSQPLFKGDPVVNCPPQQLRSSRSTRNQEHNPTPRNRAGLPDFDVTEGLPVQRWEQVKVKVNQDASADPADGNNQSTENKDSDFPWPEQPLPSFWSQLPPTNQELVRRARMGNANAKLSVWDQKTQSYIPGIELERREAARKSQQNKSKHTSTTNVDAMNVDDDEDKNEEDNDDLIDVEGLGPDPKRRKATSGSNERVFEVKKWVQVPLAVAEKMPEPKYLADRRPGMESLYKGAYKATNGFGTLGDMVAAVMSGGTTGYDLGDGGGLGNAAGVLAPGSGSGTVTTQADGTATPVRKNMPPRRKKKKIGGPGRKPKNPNPEPSSAAATAALENAAAEDTAAASTVDGDVTMRNTPETAGEGADNADGMTPAVLGEVSTQDADAEGSGSESEGEGSEEGEIASAAAPAATEVAEQVTSKPMEEVAMAEAVGAPEQNKKQEEVVAAIASASPAARPPAEPETDVDVDADADAISTPVVEQEAKKGQEGDQGVEMDDVLGALEAAVDKEAGEDA